MKRFNKNIIVFVLAFAFVFLGFGTEFRDTMKDSIVRMFREIKSGYVAGGVVDFTARVDDDATKTLSYHELLMDVDSAKNNLFNTRIIEKEDIIIAKTESGSLMQLQMYELSNDEIGAVVDVFDKLCEQTQANDAGFLYVAVAEKGYESDLPSNAISYGSINYDRFIEALNNRNIPTLNLTAEMQKEGISLDEAYFITDHHWKPDTGFWANGKVCSHLNKLYGFEYNEQYTDLTNFNIETYEDWFLGSYGKKTGRFIVSGGAEDIDIITPKFDTDLTQEQPFKNEIIRGPFDETVLKKTHINTKDYYGRNPYATYSGGDFQLQIIKNHLNPEGKKIIMIRDSMACVVTPFLSLNASELHILDMRDFANVSGERINVYDYINQEKPDYVIVLFAGIKTLGSEKYDFE